jgi:hypothetical protein
MKMVNCKPAEQAVTVMVARRDAVGDKE